MNSPSSVSFLSKHALLISAISVLVMVFILFYMARFLNVVKTYEKYDTFTVVYIYSNSCGFCTRFAPVYEEFAASSKLNCQKYEQGEPGAAKYMPYVSAFPTILIFDSNDKMIATTTGAMTLSNLKEWVSKSTA